jgi:hypothetical protein
MLRQTIPLTMLTDSSSLFSVITRSTTTLEKRLMIDLATVRDAYAAQELSDVGLLRHETNPADGLTRAARCPALEDVLDSGKLNFPVEQWVVRQ